MYWGCPGSCSFFCSVCEVIMSTARSCLVYPATFNIVPCFTSLFLLSNLVVSTSQQASKISGFLMQAGGPAFTNINCNSGSDSGMVLAGGESNIISLASWLPGDYRLEEEDVVGKCYFNESLALLNGFSTEFAFTLAPNTNGSVAAIEGMAFGIYQNTSYIGMAEGYLGVTDDGSYFGNADFKRTLAVEFDVVRNPEFNDPPYQHLGVDIGSMNSTVTSQAGYHSTIACSNTDIFTPVNLTGEGRIQAWIDYNSSINQLSVYISPLLGMKPPKPTLTAVLNLSSIFHGREDLYVGFSASSGQFLSGWAYVFDWSVSVSGPATALFPNRTILELCPSDKVKLAFVLAVSLPTTFSVIIIGVLLGGWYLRRQRRFLGRQFELLELENLDYRPRKYSYKEISRATKLFSPDQELGRGGFGIVYRGTLSTGNGSVTTIAVKRILPRTNSAQDLEEYISEMKVIGRLRHRNLVQLLGWCTEEKKGELLQVYEYMPNGGLDRLLFSKTEDGTTTLSWDQRFHIVSGLAAALVYLHEEWKQLVVHRDVKASNVLLDSEFNGRLGDFGLARLYEHSQAPEFTKVAGTFGYMAPETHTGEFSEKSDVYSFGVVALEVTTGRRVVDMKRPYPESSLVAWISNLHDSDRLLDAADARLNGKFRHGEVVLLLHIGLLCSHPDPAQRPTMRQVLQMLNRELPLLPLTATIGSDYIGTIDYDSYSSRDPNSSGSNVVYEIEEQPLVSRPGFDYSNTFSDCNYSLGR